MKEIQKVVEMLSREQESAAGGRGSVWTGKKMKSPPANQGDLLSIFFISKLMPFITSLPFAYQAISSISPPDYVKVLIALVK